MKISYKLNNNCLIKSAFIPFEPGTVCLITGIENPAFHILGGIIAKLFPIDEKLPWPQLQALIQSYSGEVKIEESELPLSSAYVGNDPDRHLLFSKVNEELSVQIKNPEIFKSTLEGFDLGFSFIERNISSLSGGEKMKLSLAIAFSKFSPCYVLHGVIPWLDKRGRQLLFEKVNTAKNENACVIFFEHETYALKQIADRVLYFDGNTSIEVLKKRIVPIKDYNLIKTATKIQSFFNHTDPDTNLIFSNVTLHDLPYIEGERGQSLIQNISFSLNDQNIYFLIGDNGAGKSTIAKLALRVLRADSGNIYICGKSLDSYSRKELINLICYVGQFPEQQIIHNNIGQFRECMRKNGNLFALYLFDKYLDLPDEYPISQLSYLQMKVICLVCFITENTKLIILDEPSWGLDIQGQEIILNIIKDISEKLRFTLLIISHDLSLIRPLSAKIFWIHDGRMKYYESLDTLLSDLEANEHFDLSFL